MTSTNEAPPLASAAAPTPVLGTITHCIFDMDGLLLDTESAYTVAQQQVLEPYGKKFTWELKAKMMGKRALDAAQLLVDELGMQGVLTAEEFVAKREVILDKLFAASALMPGVERLLRHLSACHVPMAVATSSHRRHFELKTSGHRELFALFDHIITGDQVQASKPAPDIFLAARDAWATPPASGSCLVFEDAPSGVAAAVAAGMHVVMVPDPNLNPNLFKGASQVLKSLTDFKAQEWGLPAIMLSSEEVC